MPKLRRQISDYLFLILIVDNLVLVAGWWGFKRIWHNEKGIWIATCVVLAVIIATLITWLSTQYLIKPFRLIAQAILHVSPDTDSMAAPDTDNVHLGRDSVRELVTQIYKITTAADQLTTRLEQKNIDLHMNYIATNLPLPFFVLNKDMNIVFANSTALKYISLAETDVIGKDAYSVLHMALPDNQSLEAWINSVKDNTVTATKQWNQVKSVSADKKTSLQFDLAAYYNKDNPMGYEVMLVLFDQTAMYSRDDNATDYVALAVHELRTPLTLIRSYLEVLKEKITPTTTPEEKSSIQQIDAAAQSLGAFINNVLNTARVEDGQFSTHFNEENWSSIVTSAVNDMQLRANVRNITIETQIAPNLPTAGVDKVSTYEVICNLIDNAIKYSPGEGNKKIIVSTKLDTDGLIETSVQDFGIGIPESTIPHLFDKFYRGHRNRSEISGTGLGLYLCNTIVELHGGHIWVHSKEGRGSIFTFTVQPYKQLSQKLKQKEDNFRAVHGWIKNHTLYRR